MRTVSHAYAASEHGRLYLIALEAGDYAMSFAPRTLGRETWIDLATAARKLGNAAQQRVDPVFWET